METVFLVVVFIVAFIIAFATLEETFGKKK
jgi:hypothetical protein